MEIQNASNKKFHSCVKGDDFFAMP